ncbi:hypothetical protein HMPREF0880_03720 [Yokenella regensburgei ATCC 43003]|nr:hypothetical protein HMPREF0880_03720 [Yokenella regensburgei ATCC 43003]
MFVVPSFHSVVHLPFQSVAHENDNMRSMRESRQFFRAFLTLLNKE